jgi:putative transposase
VLPLHLILAAWFGWLEGEQRDVIEFLREENRVLKAQLHGRRLRLDDNQRRRLAVIGQRLGRRLLADIVTIVTPDTILRWHRELIARKWTYTTARPRRPGVQAEIRRLAVRMATDNPSYVKLKIMWRSGLSSPHVVEIGWGSSATAAGYST